MKQAKVNTGYIRPSSLGQVKTKVEEKNERDEFLVCCEKEMERWQEMT